MMRYEEEVIQVEEEIGNYCDALLLQKRQLEKEIESLKLPTVSMCQSSRKIFPAFARSGKCKRKNCKITLLLSEVGS